jgi:hypothetical protein
VIPAVQRHRWFRVEDLDRNRHLAIGVSANAQHTGLNGHATIEGFLCPKCWTGGIAGLVGIEQVELPMPCSDLVWAVSARH